MASAAGSPAAGGAKASSFSARISVRRHSSSRALGQGNAWNRANASRRRSTSHAGSSRSLQEALEGVLGEAAGGGNLVCHSGH